MANRKSAQEQMQALRTSVLAKLARDDRARRRASHRRERGAGKHERRRWLRWLVFAAVVAAAVVSVWR
jgi:Flp pilus assembly protein TadB